MASESETPAPAAAPAAASAPTPKPKKRSYNPLRWFLKLSMRVQVLVIIGIVIVVMVVGRRKPTPATTAPAAAATATTAQPQNPTPQPQPTGPAERFPEVTPSAEEMGKLAKTNPKAIESADKLDRGVPDAMIGEIVTPPKTEDLGDEPTGRAAGVGPAGAPYVPRSGKKGGVSEVMGVFAAPARSDERSSARPATATPAVATSTGVTAAPPAAAAPRVFAPFGRFIKCKLYNTLDSLVPNNCPIIGIVVEDLTQDGHVIIPALTEVHGYVDGKPKIDANGVGRLYDTGEWTLVLPKQPGGKNGREWVIKGRAMDRRETVLDKDGRPRSWGIDDAAPGMIGYTISTVDNELAKAFAAQFFGEASRAAAQVGQTQQPSPGMAGAFGATQPEPTARNATIAAAGAGVGGSLDMVTSRIMDELKQRGFYVRVPSGKEFYVYVEQTLDPQQARIGVRREGVSRN